MNDRQVLCFLEAAKERNFTKAAENLYLTQPGVSRMIASMERELGIKLFKRSAHKTLELTDEGKLYCQMFERCREDFLSTKKKCDLIQREQTVITTLRFGYVAGWSISNFLPVILDTLSTMFPYLNFEVESHSYYTLHQMLLEGSMDFILTFQDISLRRKELEEKELCEISLIALYSSQDEKKTQLMDFRDESFYLSADAPVDQTTESLIDIFLSEHFVPHMKVLPEPSTMLFLKEVLELEKGIAVMDSWSRPAYMPQYQYFQFDRKQTVVGVYRKACAHMEVIQVLYEALAKALYTA